MWSGVGTLCGAVLLLAPVLVPGPALAFESYAEVKRVLYDQVFANDRRTFYCQCTFDSARRPDLAACGYRISGNVERANRVEVEHVVPASWIGAGRRCWREKICRDGRGRAFKGRKCCLRTDPAFRAAYQDLHNLRPVIGEINERRQNFRFAMIDGERRAFGRCDFEVEPRNRSAEPRPEIRGDIARISLYMDETHGIRLSPLLRDQFRAWNRADPPDDEERRRNRLITRFQGQSNRFVEGPRDPLYRQKKVRIPSITR